MSDFDLIEFDDDSDLEFEGPVIAYGLTCARCEGRIVDAWQARPTSVSFDEAVREHVGERHWGGKSE